MNYSILFLWVIDSVKDLATKASTFSWKLITALSLLSHLLNGDVNIFLGKLPCGQGFMISLVQKSIILCLPEGFIWIILFNSHSISVWQRVIIRTTVRIMKKLKHSELNCLTEGLI